MAFKNYYGASIPTGGTQSPQSASNTDEDLSIWERTSISAYINSSGNWISVNSERHPYRMVTIPVKAGDIIKSVQDWDYGNNSTVRVCFLSQYPSSYIDGESANVVDGGIHSVGTSLEVPEGVVCVALWTLNDGNDTNIKHFWVNDIDYAKTGREELRDELFNKGVKWVAFGDSITSGYYSFFTDSGTDSRVTGGKTYPKWVKDLNHWDLFNKAVGGKGWIMTSSDLNGVSWYTVRQVDFTKYNLVTFAFGINDWKGARTLGSIDDEYTYSESLEPSTVVEAMRYCFNYIHSKNPYCKIVVITPLNCRGYSYEYGNAASNWARGYHYVSAGRDTGTLDTFADLMIEVCKYCGVEYIDMTRFSCLTSANINIALPDGIHPSVETHEIIGRQIAAKLKSIFD